MLSLDHEQTACTHCSRKAESDLAMLLGLNSMFVLHAHSCASQPIML